MATALTLWQVRCILLNVGKRRVKLSGQIRQAVEDCGMSRYAISKATGIAESTLSRFMSGERGLPMRTLDLLADYLDLNLAAHKRTGAKGR